MLQRGPRSAAVEVAVGGAVDLNTKIIGHHVALSPDALHLARTNGNTVVIRDLATGTDDPITFTEAMPIDVLWKDAASFYVVSFSESAETLVVATYALTGEQLAVHVIETVPLDISFAPTFAGHNAGALSLLFDIEGQSAQRLDFDAETLEPTADPVDLGGPMVSLYLSPAGHSLCVGADQTLRVGGGAALPGQYRWAQWV